VRLDDKNNAMTTTVHPDLCPPQLCTPQLCTPTLCTPTLCTPTVHPDTVHPDTVHPDTVRPTFRTGKLAQPRVEYKLHNITEAVPQRVSSGVAQLP